MAPAGYHPHAPVAPPRHRHGPGGFGLQRLPGKMIQSTFQDNTAQSEAAIISNLSCSPVPTRLPVGAARGAGAHIRHAERRPRCDRRPVRHGLRRRPRRLRATEDQGVADQRRRRQRQSAGRDLLGRGARRWPTATPWTDDACYIETVKALSTVDTWRVARGGVDGLNLFDYAAPTPLVPGETYEFSFDLYPTDYVRRRPPDRRRHRVQLPAAALLGHGPGL